MENFELSAIGVGCPVGAGAQVIEFDVPEEENEQNRTLVIRDLVANNGAAGELLLEEGTVDAAGVFNPINQIHRIYGAAGNDRLPDLHFHVPPGHRMRVTGIAGAGVVPFSAYVAGLLQP